MIKALFFDIHGVITHGDFEQVYQTFANTVGLSERVVAEFHREHMQGLLTGAVSSEDMLRDLGLSEQMTAVEMLDVWKGVIVEVMRADEQMIKLLQILRPRYTLVAVTNLTEQRYVADVVMGLYEYFDHTVLSCREGIKKPDPYMFMLALERAGVQPDEAIFIDDQDKNTNAARELGLHAVTFVSYDDLRDKLERLGV